jgi:hypothetical protein
MTKMHAALLMVTSKRALPKHGRRMGLGLAAAGVAASWLTGGAAGRPLGAGTAAGAAPHVEVVPHPEQRRVEVSVDGAPFTVYIWPERLAKPVLFPIRTAGGALVTRGFPLEPQPGERVDHPHQVGLWFDHGDVNGVDFWNNSEALAPAVRARMGTIRQLAIDEARGGSGEGRLAVRLEWLLPGGGVALRERTVYAFGAGDKRRRIDRTTTLTAADGPVVFRDNKEGLFAMRVARALEEPAPEPATFTDAAGRSTTVPATDAKGASGHYTSSEGRQGSAVWGTRARWVALAGQIGDEPVVLLMLDHPKNPGHPSYWHARGYGLFAANPLGERVFSNGQQHLDLSLERGASAVFRHRLLILSSPLSVPDAEAAWREFAEERHE